MSAGSLWEAYFRTPALCWGSQSSLPEADRSWRSVWGRPAVQAPDRWLILREIILLTVSAWNIRKIYRIPVLFHSSDPILKSRCLWLHVLIPVWTPIWTRPCSVLREWASWKWVIKDTCFIYSSEMTISECCSELSVSERIHFNVFYSVPVSWCCWCWCWCCWCWCCGGIWTQHGVHACIHYPALKWAFVDSLFMNNFHFIQEYRKHIGTGREQAGVKAEEESREWNRRSVCLQ